MAKTLSIDISAARDEKKVIENRSTVAGYVIPTQRERLSFEECFKRAYPTIAAACREVDEPGLAIAAVEDVEAGKLMGLARLSARPDREGAAVLGRHDHAQLFLAAPELLALRQLVVLLDPVRSWDRGVADVSYRVLDLHSTLGLQDEHGAKLIGLRAEGPAFLRCPGHAVFLLPVGDASDWPDSPDLAWSYLPPRVYLEERAEFERRALRGKGVQRPPKHLRHSLMAHTIGPREINDLCRPGENEIAEMHLDAHGGRRLLRLSSAALDDGILLGRYDRCDGAELFAEDLSISRVHLLIIRLDDRVVAIDTGSTSGTRRPNGDGILATRLAADDHLLLGHDTELRWRLIRR